jgi:glucosamine-6-phosphate deaminase
MALTVGVATVLEAREIGEFGPRRGESSGRPRALTTPSRTPVILITGRRKALALSKCIEEGVNHLWTVSAIQLHPWALVVCDHDATAELRVKTVDYFKSIEHVQEEVEARHAKLGDNGVQANGHAKANGFGAGVGVGGRC